MARTLPVAILDALPSGNLPGGAEPTVQIGSTDIQRRMSLLATLAGQARTAAIVTSAGTLLRAAVLSAGASPQNVVLYRVADPTSAGQWSAAGVTLDSNGDVAAGVTLVQTGSAIRLFYVDSSSKSVYYRQSTDDGITWAARVLVLTRPTSGATYVECTGIAALSTTDLTAAWYVYPQAASAIFRTTFTTAWSAWVAVGPADPNQGQIRGWTCDASQPTVVYCGGVQRRAQKSGISASSATLTGGGGGVWSGWATVHPMDTPASGNGLSLAYPAVHRDHASGEYWLGVNLADDGSASGSSQSRTLLFRSTDGSHWMLGQSLFQGLWGEVHIFFIGGTQYVFDNQKVFTAPAGAALLGLEQDLLRMRIEERPGQAATFTLTLANDQGQYLDQPALRENAQVDIALGYNGVTIQTHTCYIDAIEYVVSALDQVMVVRGRCIQKFLDQVIMLPVSWTGQTMASIVEQLLPPELNLQALPATAQFSQVLPSFSMVPGQTRGQALARLAEVYGFDYASAVTGLRIVERSASDPPTWTYQQEHLGLAWQYNADQPNVVRVVGGAGSGTYTSVFADAVDAANLEVAGVHRYRHIVDRLLDTSARCQIKANLALRADQCRAQTGAITVALNPTHELLDAIIIDEPNAGLANQPARITAIVTLVDMQAGQFEQQLRLELP